MNRQLFAVICCLATTVAVCSRYGHSADRAATEDAIHQWVGELNSPDYQTREHATEQLSQAGKAAIGPVATAVERGEAEVAWRALQVLQQLSAGQDESTAEAAYEALQKLAQSNQSSIARSANNALASWREIRREAVIRRVRELGGRVQIGSSPMMAMGGIAPPLAAPLPARAELRIAGMERALEAAMKGAKDVRRPVRITVKPRALKPAKPVAKPDAKPSVATPLKPPSAPPVAPPVAPPAEPASPVAPAPDKAAKGKETELKTALEKALKALEKVEPEIVVKEPIPAPRFVAPRVEALVERRFAFDDVVVFGGVESPVARGNVASVQLDRNWKGGDDGLKRLLGLESLQSLQINDAPLTDEAIDHIARLEKLQQMHVTGTKMTAKGLRRLRKTRPNIAITATGTALIGVSGQANTRGFSVQTVAAGSGAAAAGLQVGDTITHINDQPVRHIGDLMIEVFQRDAGEKITLKFARKDGEQTVDVVLRPR